MSRVITHDTTLLVEPMRALRGRLLKAIDHGPRLSILMTAQQDHAACLEKLVGAGTADAD